MDFLSETTFPFKFPKFIPVVSGEFELDRIISLYLPLISDTALISYPYAYRNLKYLPEVPYLFVDSGSYGFIKYGGEIHHSQKIHSLKLNFKNTFFEVNPQKLLIFQEKYAFLGFTLDIPYTEKLEFSKMECLRMSVDNAVWALENKKINMLLAASISFSDNFSDFKAVLYELSTLNFDMIALGGLIPHFKNTKLILQLIDSIKSICGNIPIHIFGAGQPQFIDFLFKSGVFSVDSSSYARFALYGKFINSDKKIQNPSILEQMHIALLNLAYLSSAPLPINFTFPFLKKF